LYSFERKAASRRWRMASRRESPMAATRGSGIIVLMLKMRINVEITWSAGRVGVSIWVDRKMARLSVEITMRESPMANRGRWNTGNWAMKKRTRRTRSVTSRIPT